MSKVIRFNAGKVQYDEESKRCTPLPHKGQVTLKPSVDEEGFYDFVWAPKTSSGIEKDELLIIPGDVTFKPVKSCTTGRVLALTFLSSGAKNLYWLQDVGDDEAGEFTTKDADLVKEITAMICIDEEEEIERESQHEPMDVERDANEKVQDSMKTRGVPILRIRDILTDEIISKHLQSLLEDEIREKYGDKLPEGVEPTRDEILKVLRSEFFQKSLEELSATILENDVGHVLSNAFDYEYEGEGLDAFFNGIRKSTDRKE